MMKHTKKHMISVIMDGIRDTDMISGYAETAKGEGDDAHANWFAMRAKERYNELKRDWGEIDSDLHLHQHDDEMVICVATHIDRELERIRSHIEKM